ncbi:MAG: polysaccharide pyruvyl transferase family protein [Microcystaceae cyanobacterium]
MSDFLLSILRIVFSLFNRIYAILLSSLCRLKIIRRVPSSAIILAPADPGSLGDEAMVLATADYLEQKGIKHISVIDHTSKDFYPVNNIPNIKLRGFLVYSNWYNFLTTYLSAGWQINQYERLYCLGADMMDGYYSNFATFKRVKLVEIASLLGLSSGILGFSYNRKPTQLSQDLLSGLPSRAKLCARDQISHQRLTEFVDHSAALVADVAFLLKPVEQSEVLDKVLNWINSQKEQNKVVVGLNIHALLFNRLEGVKANDLVRVCVDALTKLHNDNQQLSFIFLPHDIRTVKGVNDKILLDRVLQKLPEEVASVCFKIPFPCRTKEIKAIVKNADCVVTGRMHLGIACMGQGTPIACITYQGKFEGLYQHFNLEPLFIAPQELFVPNQSKLVDLIHQLIKQREEIRQKIVTKLPEIKKLSEANFDSII